MSEKAENEPPARPIMEAQIDELHQRFAAFSVRHDFEPGMIIREKPSLGTMKQSENTALVFIRYLDMNVPFDLELARDHLKTKHVNTVDCMVGWIPSGSQGHLVITPHDTATLEPMS